MSAAVLTEADYEILERLRKAAQGGIVHLWDPFIGENLGALQQCFANLESAGKIVIETATTIRLKEYETISTDQLNQAVPRRRKTVETVGSPETTTTWMVFVDGTNAVVTAHAEHFQISWQRLRDYLRSFGRIFATPLVFFSERDHMRGIRRLAQDAGFLPVVCSLETTTKDSVDSLIIDSAIKVLMHESKIGIIIITGDGDMRRVLAMAGDQNRTAMIIDPLGIKKEIEGEDLLYEIPKGQDQRHFEMALRCLEENNIGEETIEDQLELLRSIVEILEPYQAGSDRLGWYALRAYIWQQLQSGLRRRHGAVIASAMNALRAKGILKQEQIENKYNVYVLEQNNLFQLLKKFTRSQ